MKSIFSLSLLVGARKAPLFCRRRGGSADRMGGANPDRTNSTFGTCGGRKGGGLFSDVNGGVAGGGNFSKWIFCVHVPVGGGRCWGFLANAMAEISDRYSGGRTEQVVRAGRNGVHAVRYLPATLKGTN